MLGIPRMIGFTVSEKRLGDSYHPNPTVYNLISTTYIKLKNYK